MPSLAWPDPFRAGAYGLEIISARAERVWPRETNVYAIKIPMIAICMLILLVYQTSHTETSY